MTENKTLTIANCCYAIVAGNFAMFTNPANQGASFTWKDFPDMMAEHCKTDVFMYVRTTKKNTQEIQELAETFGREIAERLLGRARTL